MFRHDFPVKKPFPAFLHDYFITQVKTKNMQDKKQNTKNKKNS